MCPYVPEDILVSAVQMAVWFVMVAVGLFGALVATRV